MVWERETEEPGGRAPAPGELAVVQAFLNSVDLEDGIERFDTPERLRTWLADHGLLDSTVVLTVSDVTRVISIREALRDLLSSPEEPGAAIVAAVRLAHAQEGANLRVAVSADGTVHLVPVAEGIDGAIARLMAIVYQAGIDGTWQRLKTCRNQQCRWVFYDASKNRSGTWCTMAICGAKRKARAYRRRRAGIDKPSSPPYER